MRHRQRRKSPRQVDRIESAPFLQVGLTEKSQMNQQVMAVGDVCGVVAVTGVTASVKQPYNLQYFISFISFSNAGLVVCEWCTMAAAGFSVRIHSFRGPESPRVHGQTRTVRPHPPSYEVWRCFNPKYATLHLGRRWLTRGRGAVNATKSRQTNDSSKLGSKATNYNPFLLKPLVIKITGNLSIQAWGNMDGSS
jgi:hypothetical protein